MIPPRNMITRQDVVAVERFLLSGAPLSGYLAGNLYGGQAVQRLEEMWCAKFKRRHAICVNSATSGLLAACVALEVDRHTLVNVPALSMSATAAVPHWLGATLQWLDCDIHGGANFPAKFGNSVDIGTTLFGHPILRPTPGPSILDNAQGVLSGYDDGTWSENISDICVTSFNVHKQVNCGEMGIVTTDDAYLAHKMRMFINHGENARAGENGWPHVGLNLRPTEISAVLALSQLARIDDTIWMLRELAYALTDRMPSSFSPILPRAGTKSAWYCYAFRVPEDKRDAIVAMLNGHGISCSAMYRPLYHLPAFSYAGEALPEAERLSRETIVFELCAWRYEDDIPLIASVLDKAAKI